MIKITKAREKDMFEITGEPFYGALFNKLIACPDRKRFVNGRFIFLNSFSNIEYIDGQFRTAEWEEGECTTRLYDFYYAREQETINIINKEKDITHSDFTFKTKPFAHQLKAFEISKDLIEYGLLFEQGCGKTKVALDTADYLYSKGKIKALIIVAPNGVHKNWITDEIPVHLNCEYSTFTWVGKTNKKSREEFDAVSESNFLKIYSFNIDCFVSKDRQVLLYELLSRHNCLLVIDESQKIKNHSAKRTKFLIKMGLLAKYRRICTGTPVTRGVEDIYSQFMFLNPNIIGISSYYAFKTKYCIMGGYEMKQITGYKRIEELQDKISSHSMRRLKKDCLDLPDKIYQKEYYDMTETQMSLYNSVKNKGMLLLTKDINDAIIYKEVMTKLTKMQQIASGYVIDTEQKNIITLVEPKNNPKLNKLKDLLTNIEGKVIIWTKYVADVNLIMKALGNEAVRYDGQISSEEKETNKNLFKTSKHVKYFVANLQSGSTGLTLTEASTNIYYSNSYNLEDRLQSEDRTHRIGTKNNVLYIDLICNKTNDNKIIRMLRSKKKISDMVLKDPESFFME